MKLFRIFFVVLTLTWAVFALSGCAVYDVAVEERNVGEWASDQKISIQIEQAFLEDDLIKVLDFDAKSYEGRVYLVGEYESRAQVDRAVSIAKGVEGVRTVTTYLLPKRAEDHCGTTDNLEIFGNVKKALVSDENIWSTNIDIETVQCNVVLMGIVGTQAEKDAAYRHAKAVKGVRSVKSYITVR